MGTFANDFIIALLIIYYPIKLSQQNKLLSYALLINKYKIISPSMIQTKNHLFPRHPSFSINSKNIHIPNVQTHIPSSLMISNHKQLTQHKLNKQKQKSQNNSSNYQNNNMINNNQIISINSRPKQKDKSKSKQKMHSNQEQEKKILLQEDDVIKIIQQSQQLIKSGSLIQGINLLKAMKDPSIMISENSSSHLKLLIVWNLAVAYYQTGFLQQAYDQFAQTVKMLAKFRDDFNEKISVQLKNGQQNQLQEIIGQDRASSVYLVFLVGQVILSFQIESHDEALKHARKSCKIHYEMVYELIEILCDQFLDKHQDKTLSSYDPKQYSIEDFNLYNNLLVLEYLHKLVGDLGTVFGLSPKLNEITKSLKQVKSIGNLLFKQKKIDMELMYSFDLNLTPINTDLSESQSKEDILSSQFLSVPSKTASPQESILKWIYQSKILDRIQLQSLQPLYFSRLFSTQNILNQFTKSNSIFLQCITYLGISFYCYSTQVRFVEKRSPHENQNLSTNKGSQKKQYASQYNKGQEDDILQSQHWLSRSLQIAYSFLPSNAPILNQILTVYDRFHSIDKQTIHQDKQVCGYFKVLRSLSKPKSTYSSKNTINNVPIMIRVQAPSNQINKIDINKVKEKQHKSARQSLKNSDDSEQENNQTSIDISTYTKNNKIKGLTTRIKILEFNDTIKLSSHQKHHQTHYKNKQYTTMNYLSFLQSEKDKKQRIAKIYHSTQRNSNGKKTLSHKTNSKFQNLPKTMIQMDGKARISQDLLFRPHSYDSKYLSMTVNDHNQLIPSKGYGPKEYSTLSTNSVKKRRSLSQNGRNPKQKLQKIVYNGSIKLDGLKLTGRKMNETFQIDNKFLERLTQAHSNNEVNENEKELQSKMIGGNIFINNNINLFISKSPLRQPPKTPRQQINEKRSQKIQDLDISKRQKILTKRKLSKINMEEEVFNPNQL